MSIYPSWLGECSGGSGETIHHYVAENALVFSLTPQRKTFSVSSAQLSIATTAQTKTFGGQRQEMTFNSRQSALTFRGQQVLGE